MKIPKYNIGEIIVFKDDLLTIFGKIEGIQMVNGKRRMFSYYACGRYFREEEVKLAILEAKNPKSEFYGIYPVCL